MAQTGVARAIRPAHTMLDGDTMFALSTGKRRVDINALGACAADVVEEAIRNAVRFAASAGAIPAVADLATPR
jgi:L-aminopeptidase/D-esterase-like protein